MAILLSLALCLVLSNCPCVPAVDSRDYSLDYELFYIESSYFLYYLFLAAEHIRQFPLFGSIATNYEKHKQSHK